MPTPPPEVPPAPGARLPWGRRSQLRASDEDRERAVTELAEHHSQGRINSEEFRDRIRRAYQARTSGELSQLMTDLPGPAQGLMGAWGPLRSLRSSGPFPGMGYAGFWPRAGGLWIDVIALGLVNQALHPLFHLSLHAGLYVVVPLGYFIILWATTGQTLGMWLAGVRVVRQEDGRRLGLRRSVVRLVGYLVNTVTCFAGFAWAAVDRRKQGWHDKMAGSLVVRRLR